MARSSKPKTRPAQSRPRAWSNDLAPVGPTPRDPAWDALGLVRLGMASIAQEAVRLRGRDAVMLFADRRDEGVAEPVPIWPLDNRSLGWMCVASRHRGKWGLLDVRLAAKRFGRRPDALRASWMAAHGELWRRCFGD